MILRPGPFARAQVATDAMRVLVAVDDTSARDALLTVVRVCGWVPVAVTLGEAGDALLSEEAPQVAVIDCDTSHDVAADLVKAIRGAAQATPPYLIVLVDASNADDTLSAMDAGADDCLTKPFVASELQARLRVAVRTLGLQDRVRTQVRELQATAAQVRQLQNLLPMCSYCRRIRDDEHRWQPLDEYLSHYTHVRFTHGFCPQCYEQHVQPSLEAS